MPTYEYACKFCGKHLEIHQPITAEPLKRCPACKKLGLKRLISGGAGLIFKGTGFYETDYRRAPVAPAAPVAADKKATDAKPKSEPVKPPAANPAKS